MSGSSSLSRMLFRSCPSTFRLRRIAFSAGSFHRTAGTPLLPIPAITTITRFEASRLTDSTARSALTS